MGYFATTETVAAGKVYRRTPDRIRKTPYPRHSRGLFGQRYYSPEVGRWISRDPIGEAAGRNVQVFASNRPLSARDGIGLTTDDEEETVGKLNECEMALKLFFPVEGASMFPKHKAAFDQLKADKCLGSVKCECCKRKENAWYGADDDTDVSVGENWHIHICVQYYNLTDLKNTLAHELTHAKSMCAKELPACTGVAKPNVACCAAKVCEEMKAYRCQGNVPQCSGPGDTEASWNSCFNYVRNQITLGRSYTAECGPHDEDTGYLNLWNLTATKAAIKTACPVLADTGAGGGCAVELPPSSWMATP